MKLGSRIYPPSDVGHPCWRRRTTKIIAVALVFLSQWSLTVSAASQMYSDKQLAEDKKRYAQKFEFLYEKGLRNFMTPDERRTLVSVVIRHPPRGASPLSIKSVVFEGVPTVIAPVMSLKFIEDLSVAYAWRYTNEYSLEPMDEYLVMLKHRSGEGSSGEWAPAPMAALGVPAKIWEQDKKIDDLSLRFRNTAWAFILAHELGHLKLGHTQTEVSSAQMQDQEEAADEFAVDLLGRSDTIPMGMILWFQATAGYMRNRSDFSSDAAYLAWERTEASHPVNGSRMKALALTMQRQAGDERDSIRADILNFIATRLATIGETVEDPDMQQLLKRCATLRRPADLKRLDDRSCL